MTARVASLALGVTLAILPAAAPAAAAGSGFSTATDETSRGFDLDAGGPAVPYPNAPLPPARPDVLGRPEAPASTAERAEPIAEPEAGSRIVTMVLPPLRPSVALAGQAPAAQPAVALLPPPRRAVRPDPDPDPVETGSIAAPAPARSLFSSMAATTAAPTRAAPARAIRGGGHDGLDDLIAAHARRNDVPEDLVHRVVIRESRYNPRAMGRGGALGLMQIKHATARALGYDGPATGLLDADTNLTYAVKYLAGAYRTAGGNYDRAVSYYARGYYYAAKRQRLAEADVAPERRGRRLRAEAAPARTTRATSLAVADNGRIERTFGSR